MQEMRWGPDDRFVCDVQGHVGRVEAGPICVRETGVPSRFEVRVRLRNLGTSAERLYLRLDAPGHLHVSERDSRRHSVPPRSEMWFSGAYIGEEV